jgi:hypothetical protein
MFSALKTIGSKCKEAFNRPRNQAIGAVVLTSMVVIYTLVRQLLSLEDAALSNEHNPTLTLTPAESASALTVIENIQAALVSAVTLLLPHWGQVEFTLPPVLSQLLSSDTTISCALTRTLGLSLAISNQGVWDRATLALLLGEIGCLPTVSAASINSSFPATLSLAKLSAQNGFNIIGVTADLSGSSVSSAGDVNGDGVNDLIIGAPYANSQAGTSYVVFGASDIGSTGTLSLTALNGSNGFKITGVTAGDLSGISVSSAGDVNGDGINDLFIGAYGANSDAGASYVVFGASGISSTGALSLAALNGVNGFKITGVKAGDNSGWPVSSAGDVNGDGINDLIIGAYRANNDAGASYVVFGASGIGSTGTLSLAALNGVNGFNITGVRANDWSGWSVSSVGDVNGDGINDLIIGAPKTNSTAGASYVVFGANGIGSTGTLSLAALNGVNGFKITGVTAGDESGRSVSSAGDVNGDGINDLIIGAFGANSKAGASYVVFGASGIGSTGTLSLAALNGSNGFKITGVKADDQSGYPVSSAGDVNGDGINDLIIGAYFANNYAGASYVVFGTNGIGSTGTLSLAALNGVNGFNISGVTAGDWSGVSVSSAGDVNGDGVDDLIIGARGANNLTGASYVIFGRRPSFLTSTLTNTISPSMSLSNSKIRQPSATKTPPIRMRSTTYHHKQQRSDTPTLAPTYSSTFFSSRSVSLSEAALSSVTRQRSLSATQTLDVASPPKTQPPLGPLARFLHPEAAVAVASSAQIATAITGLLLPTSANKASATRRIAAVSNCPYVEEAYDLNPILFVPPIIALTLGSDDANAALINGAISSTTVLMTLSLAALLGTAHLQNTDKAGYLHKLHKMVSVLLALMLSYYGPNVIEIAILAVGHFSAADKVLSLGAIGLWSGVFLWTLYQVQQTSSKDAALASKLWLSPLWEPTREYDKKASRLLVFEDILVANLLSMLSGIKPGQGACRYVALSMLAVSFMHLGYLVKLSPYEQKLEQRLMVGNALLQVLLSALCLGTTFKEDDNLIQILGAAELASFSYLYVQTILLTGAELKEQYDKRQKPPQQTTLAAPLVNKTQNPLLESGVLHVPVSTQGMFQKTPSDATAIEMTSPPFKQGA